MGGHERGRLREKKKEMVGEGKKGQKKDRKEQRMERINVLSTAAGSSVSVLHLQKT